MQTFTIRDIENLTGIKAHTLRIWETRYQFFKPHRKQSKHRYYDNNDLKKLINISSLYHNGYKISKIASLSEADLTTEVLNLEVSDNHHETIIQRLLAAAIDFNESAFLKLLDDVISRVGFERCIIEVCYPYLLRVGLLWDTNNIIPAQEHFSSYLIQNKIIAETDKYTSSDTGVPEILLFSPEFEHHELPLLYINYLLRKEGWKVLYLGPNIKLLQLKQVMHLADVKYLYMHFLTNLTKLHIDDYLEELRKTFPEKYIVASGRGTEKNERNFTNFFLLRKDQEIYDFIQRKLTP